MSGAKKNAQRLFQSAVNDCEGRLEEWAARQEIEMLGAVLE